MPALQPAELWQESGRWEFYGTELLRFTDRHGRDCCLGPDPRGGDHRPRARRGAVLPAAADEPLPDPDQVPRRDPPPLRPDARPRVHHEGRLQLRRRTRPARTRATARCTRPTRASSSRCGLEFVAVEADTGAIGGSFSHEFMVLADSGEDAIAACAACGYAANLEKAEVAAPRGRSPSRAGWLRWSEVATPGRRTIEEVAGVPRGRRRGHRQDPDLRDRRRAWWRSVVRGDHDVNEVKVKNAVGANAVGPGRRSHGGRKVTGAPVGFAGPVGLELPGVSPTTRCRGAGGFVVGANEADAHYRQRRGRAATSRSPGGPTCGRSPHGDPCPRCGEPVSVRRGIEVGHVFKLGTKYSEALGATFLDDEGKERPLVMGCYGIGVGRTAAAAIEQNHDDDGIIWPVPLAPWEVAGAPHPGEGRGDPGVPRRSWPRASEAAGVEVLVDDRDERAGGEVQGRGPARHSRCASPWGPRVWPRGWRR